MVKTAALLERRRLPINGASRVGVVEGVSGGADGGGEGVSENGRDSETGWYWSDSARAGSKPPHIVSIE